MDTGPAPDEHTTQTIDVRVAPARHRRSLRVYRVNSPRLVSTTDHQQPSTASLSTLSSFILADFFTYQHWHFQSMVVEGQSSVGVQITGALPVPVTPVWTLDGGRL